MQLQQLQQLQQLHLRLRLQEQFDSSSSSSSLLSEQLLLIVNKSFVTPLHPLLCIVNKLPLLFELEHLVSLTFNAVNALFATEF